MGQAKDNIYQVLLPPVDTAAGSTVAESADVAGDARPAPHATIASGTSLAWGATINMMMRIRDSTVGRARYSGVDFVEDVKCACAREGLPFDNDIFDELVR